MAWFDWLIVIFPVIFVLWVGFFCRRYAKDVTGFISSGRVCGRYVILVGDVAEALSVLSLLAYIEVHYKTGFAASFWTAILTPISIIMGLFGYCYYRMRETKAQSLGEYLEMRYSRKLRVFAAALRSFSEIFANMILPALAARFFIYFLGLPAKLHIFGMTIPTYQFVMLICLFLVVFIIWFGGSIAVNVTDTVQGFLCYPLLVFFVCFLLYKFSWSDEIIPVLQHKVEGESTLNPFDVEKLRDFNLFSLLLLPFVSRFLNRMNWFGGGSSSTAARSAHEQKMAGLLGGWRGSLGNIFYVLVGLAVIVLLNHHKFAKDAHDIRLQLSDRIANEIIENPKMRSEVMTALRKLPPAPDVIGKTEPFSNKKNPDTRYLETGHEIMIRENASAGHTMFQKFRTLYYQQMGPVALRNLLPPGIIGLFCVLMVMLMVSTDNSRMFSSAVTISQDVILPFFKKPLDPQQHIALIRWVTLGVGVVFFLGSNFMSQLDYINLFINIVTTVWSGGAGPVMVLGLYTRFGNTWGAWASILNGTIAGVTGILIQRNWPDHIYPFLERMGWVDDVTDILVTLSKPLNPYIVWEMNPVKCPVNSYEWMFITMIVSLILYCVVSKLTSKELFNLDRMLHRGEYAPADKKAITSAWTWKNFYNKMIGITPEYTTGDKCIAWGYFFYSFVYRFGLSFVGVVIWNLISPWSFEYWGWYFAIVFLIVPGTMTAFTMFWFFIGGLIDLKRMFRDLEARVINPLDNGQVEGHMSLADKAEFEKAKSAPKTAAK
ncbi:MAG: sodium:panthothenate symporter [Lentisphaerae bacterium]|nr:sodium:panthothenate symporter [Lentisphaerota bacterium]